MTTFASIAIYHTGIGAAALFAEGERVLEFSTKIKKHNPV
jgi:hypothetical protein